MLLYSLFDCHYLSTGEIPLGGKSPFPALHRNVGAIGEVAMGDLPKGDSGGSGKEKKWHMHLSWKRMKFFTVSLYPGIQPPEGAWTRGK